VPLPNAGHRRRVAVGRAPDDRSTGASASRHPRRRLRGRRRGRRRARVYRKEHKGDRQPACTSGGQCTRVSVAEPHPCREIPTPSHGRPGRWCARTAAACVRPTRISSIRVAGQSSSRGVRRPYANLVSITDRARTLNCSARSSTTGQAAAAAHDRHAVHLEACDAHAVVAARSSARATIARVATANTCCSTRTRSWRSRGFDDDDGRNDRTVVVRLGARARRRCHHDDIPLVIGWVRSTRRHRG